MLAALGPGSAVRAGNGPEPRTPVDWTGTPCMRIVDRSVDPVLHIDYGIPMQDDQLTDDELEDSRTHQFFALCRARTPQEFMPRWITWDDVDRARAIDIAPDNIYASDVLESAEAWAGCWHRINADDDRRPITHEAAAAGVDWDTTGVPAGAYVLDGYTWEPPSNLWTPCPSVVKVVDDPDPAASPPAASITTPEAFLEVGEGVAIEGCVSAEPGSVLHASWALPTSEVVWEPIVEEAPVQGEGFSFDFVPPQDLVGAGLMIRVTVQDPSGRSYATHMTDRVYVVGDDDPGPCDDGSVFVPGPGCGGSSSGGEEASTGEDAEPGSGSSTGTDDVANASSADGAGDPGGCGCSSGADAGAAWMLLLGLLGVRRRRCVRAQP